MGSMVQFVRVGVLGDCERRFVRFGVNMLFGPSLGEAVASDVSRHVVVLAAKPASKTNECTSSGAQSQAKDVTREGLHEGHAQKTKSKSAGHVRAR